MLWYGSFPLKLLWASRLPVFFVARMAKSVLCRREHLHSEQAGTSYWRMIVNLSILSRLKHLQWANSRFIHWSNWFSIHLREYSFQNGSLECVKMIKETTKALGFISSSLVKTSQQPCSCRYNPYSDRTYHRGFSSAQWKGTWSSKSKNKDVMKNSGTGNIIGHESVAPQAVILVALPKGQLCSLGLSISWDNTSGRFHNGTGGLIVRCRLVSPSKSLLKQRVKQNRYAVKCWMRGRDGSKINS